MTQERWKTSNRQWNVVPGLRRGSGGCTTANDIASVRSVQGMLGSEQSTQAGQCKVMR